MENKKNFKKILILLLVILGISFIIFYNLRLDPMPYDFFGTSWIDEGNIIKNARNQVLFNTFILKEDLNNGYFFAPVLNILVKYSFLLFGVNTFSMRIVSAILGFLSVLILSLFIMKKNYEKGFLYLIFAGFNLMLVAFSRVAMMETASLFFLSLIFGLIIYDSKTSWILAGILTPFMFFSKITSFFFIPAILLSCLFYKKFKELKYFILGLSGSLLLWLSFFLIPNAKNWYLMNLNFKDRIGMEFLPTLIKTIIFSFTNFILIVILIIAIKKKKKDFLIKLSFITIVLFFIQILFSDSSLRRFVLILPFIIYICADYLINSKYKKLIILLYLFGNLTIIFSYFLVATSTVPQMSLEINNYIPDNSLVYGEIATALSLENKIKPYYIASEQNQNEPVVLKLLKNEEINYVIFREFKIEQARSPEIYDYVIKHFQTIKTLEGINTRCDGYSEYYILRRKNAEGKL